MRKIPRTAKLDEAVGRVQFGSPRNFLNPIISKLDKHVVLLPINYRASKNRKTWQIFYLTSLRSARHRSNTLIQVFVIARNSGHLSPRMSNPAVALALKGTQNV